MAWNQGYSYRHTIEPQNQGSTVLDFLAREFAHSTREEWQTRITAGEVLLQGQRVCGEDPLRAGDLLLWNRPPWDEEDVPRQFGLIHIDEHLIVVDKPSGLPTLPGAGFLLNTLLSAVQEQYPEAIPLHRLGRATSGLVLLARDRRTASQLQSNWSLVHKQYRALASGVAQLEEYDIQFPIGPVEHSRLGTVHAASPAGKPAHSVARVLERRRDSTVFEVDLITGRPHQIRIHLATIGHPLVGDPLYAAGGRPRADSPGLPGDSGYHLHARRLEFVHPANAQLVTCEAPLPQRLRLGAVFES